MPSNARLIFNALIKKALRGVAWLKNA